MWLKKKNYQDFPLIVKKLGEGYQYFMYVYSGERKLLMLLDSGATTCQISDNSLEGCHYELFDDISPIIIADGSTRDAQSAVISLSLNDKTKVKKNHYCSFEFMVMPKETFTYFSNGLDGLLGSNFLQYCVLDFVNKTLRVYYS